MASDRTPLDISAKPLDDPDDMTDATALSNIPAIYFGIAAVCFYVAARFGSILFRVRKSPHAGGLAVAHWLPIAAVAMLAARDHRALAVSVIFSSSVAAVLLAMGVAIFSSTDRLAMASPNRRAWSMALPMALLALLVGFSAAFTPLHAGMFFVQGVLAWMLWSADPLEQTIATATLNPVSHDSPNVNVAKVGLAIIAALALALIGGAFAVHAATAMSDRTQRLGEGVIGTLMIAPALALPLLGTSLNLARNPQRGGEVVSLCTGCVLLNLGLLLPAVILVAHLATAFSLGGQEAISHADWLWTHFDPPPLPFPITIWRIDTVALVLIGGMLLPVAAGRWTLRKFDGGILLLAYAIYVLVTARTSLR